MKRIFSIAAVMAAVFLLSVYASASNIITLQLPVTVEQDSGAFCQSTVSITGDTGTEPMPGDADGTYTLTFTQADTQKFPSITFTDLGTYYYTVRQSGSDGGNCDYDTSVYHLTVYVTNSETEGYEATVIAYLDGATENDKQAEILFINKSIVAETEETESTETETDTKTDSAGNNTSPVKTGDETPVVFLLALLLISGAILSGWHRKFVRK